MRVFSRIAVAFLVAFSLSSYANFGFGSMGMGTLGAGNMGNMGFLGEQGFGSSGSFGVSCLCARQVAAGMPADANCEQNVKLLVDRVIQSNPSLRMQLGQPAILHQQGVGNGAAAPSASHPAAI